MGDDLGPPSFTILWGVLTNARPAEPSPGLGDGFRRAQPIPRATRSLFLCVDNIVGDEILSGEGRRDNLGSNDMDSNNFAVYIGAILLP
jgi:hypothetical protein